MAYLLSELQCSTTLEQIQCRPRETDEPRRDHLGVVEDEEVPRSQQCREIRDRFNADAVKIRAIHPTVGINNGKLGLAERAWA
jgi:hypothetical protein